MNEKSRRAGGREGGGDLAGDVARFAHAGDDEPALGGSDQFHGGDKGLSKAIVDGRRKRIDAFRFGVERTQRRFDERMALALSWDVSQLIFRHVASNIRDPGSGASPTTERSGQARVRRPRVAVIQPLVENWLFARIRLLGPVRPITLTQDLNFFVARQSPLNRTAGARPPGRLRAPP